jgi:hypothetical protein
MRALAVGLLVVSSAARTAEPAVSVANRLLAAQPGDDLLIEIGDSDDVARIDRDALSSGTVDLRKSPGRLVGHVGVESAELVLEPRRVLGQIGDRNVSLDVLRSTQQMRITGTFGARAVDLTVSPSAIGGQVGPCSYRLSLQRDQYSGQVECGGGPEPVILRFPVAFVARDDEEIAAMLTALLAR